MDDMAFWRRRLLIVTLLLYLLGTGAAAFVTGHHTGWLVFFYATRLVAGMGIGVLPQFIVQDALAKKQLEIVLPEWSLPVSAVYWLTPPGGPRPKRVETLAEFFASRLARKSGSKNQV